jgi:hypothetical protein
MSTETATDKECTVTLLDRANSQLQSTIVPQTHAIRILLYCVDLSFGIISQSTLSSLLLLLLLPFNASMDTICFGPIGHLQVYKLAFQPQLHVDGKIVPKQDSSFNIPTSDSVQSEVLDV